MEDQLCKAARRLLIAAGLFVVLLGGCETPGGDRSGRVADSDRVFLTVDFESGRTLRYRFVSDRRILLDWDPNATTSPSRVQEQTERLEMVVAYTPVEVDPYGVSTIEATVESVDVARSESPSGRSLGPDAVESAEGRTFQLQVDPRGRIVETAGLDAFVRELGEKAFRADTSRGRIKEPDLVGDFIASQRFLWDPIASIEEPAEGVAVGETWDSHMFIPLPMVLRLAREVIYRLEEVRLGEDGPVAVIRSQYSPADAVPAGWPVPYAGRFQMSGTFGFLGPYEVLGLEGGGETLFDLEQGRIEEKEQKYRVRIRAGIPPMGIKADPHITIHQTLTMKRLP